MKELIQIKTNEQGQQLVSARDLHEGLEIKTDFRKWFPRMCEYGFEESVDYTPDFFVHPLNKQETKDYIITLDMAKEICMLQRSELGKQFRKYFIECEKKLREVATQEQLKASLLLNIYNGGQEGILAAKQLTELETKPLLEKIEKDKPLVSFATQVTNSSDCIDIGQFAKIIKDENINIGRNKLFKWLRDSGYLMNNNTPYQKYIDNNYFKVIEVTKETAYGVKTYTKTLVTGKGQVCILEKLREIFN